MTRTLINVNCIVKAIAQIDEQMHQNQLKNRLKYVRIVLRHINSEQISAIFVQNDELLHRFL